jgi:hypothetical protein
MNDPEQGVPENAGRQEIHVAAHVDGPTPFPSRKGLVMSRSIFGNELAKLIYGGLMGHSMGPNGGTFDPKKR